MDGSQNKKDYLFAQSICKELQANRLTKQAYDPARKIDPFEPLFQEKTNSVKPENTPNIDHHPIKGPLESIDTSQLKLTGIIYATSRNFALVQEASGKGHVIKKGTCFISLTHKHFCIITPHSHLKDIFG